MHLIQIGTVDIGAQDRPHGHPPADLLDATAHVATEEQSRFFYRLQSFRIEVPCDNSCYNSWSIGCSHGHSRSVNGMRRGLPEIQNRRPEGV